MEALDKQPGRVGGIWYDFPWQALCGRHQVVKKNYWDSATGKMNYIAIVQAAPVEAKNEILAILLDYFGYKIEDV